MRMTLLFPLVFILACALFLADLAAGPAIAFGLPDLILLLVVHRLSEGRQTTLAAAIVSMMVVAAPLYLSLSTGGAIPPDVIGGRVVVLLATWLVAALLHERDVARAAMRLHGENFEEKIQRQSGEMRQVNAQLHHEIHERRRAEHRSRYLASIVESSGDAIIGQSLDGMIESWNLGAARVYGFDGDEMIGQPAARLVPIEREVEMRELLACVMRGQRVEPIETRCLRKDGVSIDVSVSVSPIIDEQGAIVGVSLVERDISRLKRTEDALRSLNLGLEARVRERTGEFEAALNELKTFSCSVSNGLRAPLGAVQRYGAALEAESGSHLGEEGLGLLRRIRAVSSHMDKLIGDILMLSEENPLHMQKETVNLSSLAREVADDLVVLQRDRRVEWCIAYAVETWGDSRLLRLVMQNLLGNAFKYSRDRQVATIEFGVERPEGQEPIFFVRDNGVGFDQALAEDLFEPFRRTNWVDDFEWSGIGLAMVAKIMRSHGGRVWAQGESGKGATFRFQLPPASGPAASVK